MNFTHKNASGEGTVSRQAAGNPSAEFVPRSPPKSAAVRSAGSKVVNLALQGGGTHGAFGWGVIDRLLEDERIDFEGITASSAGAVNAIFLADGLARGGRAKAREALSTFWKTLSEETSR
ncbi:MAG: patatin-like phospholipase family protein, partial [Hyphomicrobiales bacterium]|nr:patatin-like phospholipase family protein [Hyphomicrobiales bacterium]